MMTKRVPTLPTPWMKSRRTALPKSGGGSIFSGAMSITSRTASTSSPSSTRSPEVPPFGTASKITMQVFLPMLARGRPKRDCRSITGTTAPRRLMTPRSGALPVLPPVLLSKSDAGAALVMRAMVFARAAVMP